MTVRERQFLAARAMRLLYFEENFTQTKIARIFGIRQASVSRIVAGQTHPHQRKVPRLAK